MNLQLKSSELSGEDVTYRQSSNKDTIKNKEPGDAFSSRLKPVFIVITCIF